MQSIHDFIQNNKSQFLSDLSEFLSIPSVSTQPEHKKDMEKAALWLKNYLQKIGLTNCHIMKTKGHPAVFGEYKNPKNEAPPHSKHPLNNLVELKSSEAEINNTTRVKKSPDFSAKEDKKTILIYGHYDVQPPEPMDEWKSPPFKPTIRQDKIYARGTSDNKGQLFINLWALKYFLDQKTNPGVNIKFIIEGEEESGGKNLENFIKRHKRLLQADLAFISDSAMLSRSQPAISYGTRGIVYFELEVIGPKHDIHSGSYGGIIQNPTNALARIISHLQNDNGELIIPGFDRNIRKITAEERKFLQKQITKHDIMRDTGVSELIGDRNQSVEEIVGAKPSLDVHGIWGGFRKQGEKTIIPDKVTCKLSIRTVPFMTGKDVIEKFSDFVRSVKPRGVKTKINVLSYCEPYWLDHRDPLINKASDLVYDSLKVFPKLTLEGGSIPAPTYFKTYLGIDTLLLGYGLPDDNLHAPNEKMDLVQFWKGIRTSILLYQKLV